MEIVKYHNDANNFTLGTLKEKEVDLFFCLLFKCKEQGTRKQILTFEELRHLSNQERTDRIVGYLNELLKKLLDLKSMNRGCDQKGKYSGVVNIFSSYKLYEEIGELEISISEDFQYILNDLIGNFTIFDLKELVNLKGKYAKTLFRLLKQWESTKKYLVKVEDFRELVGVPKSYRQCDIDDYILTPSLEELKKHFKNLKVEKVKKGVKIDSFIFTWTSERKAPSLPIHKAFEERKQGAKAEDYPEIFEIKDSLELLKINLIGSTKGQVPRTSELKFIIAVTNAENESELKDICELYGATYDFNGGNGDE